MGVYDPSNELGPLLNNSLRDFVAVMDVRRNNELHVINLASKVLLFEMLLVIFCSLFTLLKLIHDSFGARRNR